MGKPRSKVLRRVSAKPNPEIKRVLSKQAQKKRLSDWSSEDAPWEPEFRCNASATSPCTHPCGNPSCPNYSVLYDPYYTPPSNSLLLKGIPTDSSGRNSEIDVDLDALKTINGVVLPIQDVAPIAEAEAIVTFETSEDFKLARTSKVVNNGGALYVVRQLPFVSRMLIDRLQDMDDCEQMLDVIDKEDDPLVGAALIPGLRRSDFTKPVASDSFICPMNESCAQRLRKLLYQQ